MIVIWSYIAYVIMCGRKTLLTCLVLEPHTHVAHSKMAVWEVKIGFFVSCGCHKHQPNEPRSCVCVLWVVYGLCEQAGSILKNALSAFFTECIFTDAFFTECIFH